MRSSTCSPWCSRRGRRQLALAVLGLTEGCQHAIAYRTRPAVPPALRQADDSIRRVGAAAVGYAASGAEAALLAIGCVILRVDTADPVPAYEQIRLQVTAMVASGALVPGTQLPTIRQLAADLGLAKGTVSRAYEMLLRDRVVESRGRSGTIVTDLTPDARLAFPCPARAPLSVPAAPAVAQVSSSGSAPSRSRRGTRRSTGSS